MWYLRDRVFFLKKEPFREQDRRVWMYGQEHGLLSAVARGASSPASKQVGHLEPLSCAEVMIAKGAAFDTLAVAHQVGMVQRLSFSSAVILGGFADLIFRLTRPGIQDPRLFQLLRESIETLSRMPEEPSPERARLLFAVATVKLLDCIGFAPRIDRAAPGTTPVPSLALAHFLRTAPFSDAFRVTGSRGSFNATSSFIEAALKHTPLEEEPRGVKFLTSVLCTSPAA